MHPRIFQAAGFQGICGSCHPAASVTTCCIDLAADEEEELDLADLIGKGEVAWLHKEDAPAQPQRPPPKPPRRQDSPPLAGLDDLPSASC